MQAKHIWQGCWPTSKQQQYFYAATDRVNSNMDSNKDSANINTDFKGTCRLDTHDYNAAF